MNKTTFFLAAMRAEEYRRRAWVLAAFSLISEAPDAWRKNPYPYRVVQTTTGYFYVDPNNNNELTKIDDAVVGKPLLAFKDRLLVKAGEIPNLAKDTDTTFGNVLVNYIALVYSFGSKVPYVEGRINPRQLEALILPRLKDTPPEGEARDDKYLYVDEYLRFAEGMFSLTGFTQLCVPAGTERSMLPAPGIIDLRNKLIEENKDNLQDPAVIAKIDAELVAYDRAYMKGDLSEGFLISGKSFNIVRKTQFGMQGAVTGFNENGKVDLVPRSLSEGWDPNYFPQMNNASRSGSYGRGAETQQGGARVKDTQRASTNLAVVQDDCGTQLGYPVDVDDSNYKQLVGFSLVGKDNTPVADIEAAKKYIGKRVLRRSPQFCKSKLTDYCQYCVGATLAANPAALSTAVSAYGSTIMLLSMSAMHGKVLSVQRLDWQNKIF